MIELNKFHVPSVNEWLIKHIDTSFLKRENDFIIPNPHFSVIIPKDVYEQEIKTLYVNNEEKGGLFFCSLSTKEDTNQITVEMVLEIENVYKTNAEDPNGSRVNRYRPNWEKYIEVLEENFSQQDSSKILFPIHFHTHPTIDQKAEKQYYKTYSSLNTSDADQRVAKLRHLKFNNINFRYLNAIITGHEDTHNILVYAEGVTPLDFVNVKVDRINNSFKKGGEDLADLTDNEDTKAIVTLLSKAGGLFINAAFHDQRDYMSHFFGDNEYFTTLKNYESTIVQIPQIDENGNIMPLPKKDTSVKFIRK